MVRHITLLVCFLGTALFISPAEARFGFRRNKNVQPEELVENHVHSEPEQMSPLTEQEAVDVAGLLNKAKNDPQTMTLVALMKQENADSVAQLSSEMSKDEITLILQHTLNEIKQLDDLFRTPERALIAMQEEGMIDSSRVQEYRADPALLEEDTRRAYYYQFVTIAVAGGYL